jgi:hypothetical protein
MSKELEYKKRIIEAGYKAVEHLISVAEKVIVESRDDDEALAADRLKNAAASKKLAVFDAFEILSRIESERQAITEPDEKKKSFKGFAEGRTK